MRMLIHKKETQTHIITITMEHVPEPKVKNKKNKKIINQIWVETSSLGKKSSC